MMPIIPHFASECIYQNNFKIDHAWPSFDEKMIIEENVNFVVQINGKKRGLVQTSKDISEEKLLKLIMTDNNLIKYFKDKIIKRKIFVRGKLINFII